MQCKYLCTIVHTHTDEGQSPSLDEGQSPSLDEGDSGWRIELMLRGGKKVEFPQGSSTSQHGIVNYVMVLQKKIQIKERAKRRRRRRTGLVF